MSDLSRVEKIFYAALEKKTPAERAAYLAEACGESPEMRPAVERLLAAHDQAGSFLDRPPTELMPTVDLPRGAADPNLRDGAHVGPYRLLEQIGEGGMGVVYMADQQEPIRRRVALKIIKPGLDTRQVIARFEAERRALALMDHPNIARVLDGGTTDSGRSYFVMELVRGVPITEYCDANNLPVHERLELFTQVCQAVQHAHQKGIIHRDIKPSNVLVTMNDGRAVPKVIDFGVAKAINQQLTDKTLFTNFAQIIGTPLYMSPEQAEMSSLDVDTRTDIYSLGVLLYELLTGTTPFDREVLREAAYDEVRRIIREQVPPLPSLRISTLGQSRTVVAAHRRADPHRLSQMVQGDLDWIVMKALDKDRTRRYETAVGFAADVKRHLLNQPVEACPPSAAYRFRKFARRNRTVIATVATIFSALVLGTAISSWQAIRATRAERRADEQAAEAQANEQLALSEKRRADTKAMEAEAKALEAMTERERALDAFQKARQAVDDSFTAISENHLLSVPGLQPLRKELLQHALEYYEGFVRESSDDPRVKLGLAAAYLRTGHIRQLLGETAEAEMSYQRAINALQDLIQVGPDTTLSSLHSLLASAYMGLGNAINNKGRKAEAEAAYKLSIDTYEKLVEESPLDPNHKNGLARGFNSLGSVQSATGRKSEAEASHRKSIDLSEELAKEYPNVLSYRSSLADAYDDLSYVMSASKRMKEAQILNQQAVDIWEKLANEQPKDLDYRTNLASSYEMLGYLQRSTGDSAESEVTLKKSIAIHEDLARENPAVPGYQSKLARVYRYLAFQQLQARRMDEATDSCKTAIDVQEKLMRDHPMAPYYQDDLAGSYNQLGILQIQTGATSEGEASYKKAIEILEKLVQDDPKTTSYQITLGGTYVNLGHSQLDTGHKSEALALYRKATKMLDRVREIDPADKTAAHHADVAHVRILSLWAFGGLGDRAEVERCAAAISAYNVTEPSRNIALGATYYRLGKYADAETCLKRGVATANVSISMKLNNSDEEMRCDVAIGQLVQAMNEFRRGDLQKATDFLARGTHTVEDLRELYGENGAIPLRRSKGIDIDALANEANTLINKKDKDSASQTEQSN